MLDDALARPYNIHAVNGEGLTALVNVAYNAQQHEYIFPLVDRLLAAGAERSLLEAGADPTLRNRSGNTAVQATFPTEHGVEDPRAFEIRHFVSTYRHPNQRCLNLMAGSLNLFQPFLSDWSSRGSAPSLGPIG